MSSGYLQHQKNGKMWHGEMRAAYWSFMKLREHASDMELGASAVVDSERN